MATKARPKRYEVLKPVRNDKTNKYWPAGDTVTAKDFSVKVIAGWLACNPPVLKEV
jgi:hypothetical protein